MHATDSSATKETAGADSPPRHAVIRSDGDEGSEKHDDWDEEGYGGNPTRVGNLQIGLSVSEVDGSVTNEMLDR